MKHSVFNVMTLLVLVVLSVSCGKRPQVVTGIAVESQTLNGDVHLALRADLNLGNMSLPAVTLPILHPHGQTPIGSVELAPVLGGKNQVSVKVNISSITNVHATTARLPNGNVIPLIANNPTIVIPLGAGAQLYLTLAANAVAIGVAVPVRQFDSIGASVGGVNLFPVFMVDQVQGAAGIFTSRNAGQNGFAIIADVTSYVRMQDIYTPVSSARLALSSQIPSAAQEQKIGNAIYQLNQRKTRLQLR